MLAWTLVLIYGISFLYAWVLTQIRLHPEFIKTVPIYEHPNVNTFEDRKPLIFFNIACFFAIGFGVGKYINFAFDYSFDLPWWNIALQIVFMACMDDLWFYFSHRFMHENDFLFRRIHSIHHRVRSTLPLDYIYVHPVEWMIGGFGMPLAWIILYFTLGSISAYAFILFLSFKVIHEINIHSGIESWVLERHPLKFIGSSEHHGGHHYKIKGNYASSFKHLDKVLKTDL